MNEMPHLNTAGTAFFNGSQWALVTRHHLSDGIPAWAYDLFLVLLVLGAIIGMTLAIAAG